MRERIPLKENTELRFTNHAGGNMRFIVGKVAGFGGSCIVYDGYYLNNAGFRNTVRMKECFPYKLHIERLETGELVVADREREQFEAYKNRLRKSFEIANGLHEARGLTNLTANVFDLYEANHTVYMVSSYVEGNTLADVRFDTLRDAVRAVISTARCIEGIHGQGYLYLDVKPENILMYNETPDLIQLLDFDSVIPLGAQEDITEYRVSYTIGFAPVEQKTGKMALLGRYTDVYSVGALCFYLLFGRAPRATDCGLDVVYDYSKLKWDCLFRQKVYQELTVFFCNTLQAYHMDRYQEMSEAIAQLERLEISASLPVPFVCSGYVANNDVVVGREEECDRLLNWYNGSENLLFVTGMGGIGKSTVVRKFVNDNRELFDSVVYLQYQGSVCETITDDVRFCITGCEKNADESQEEYFARKRKTARELAVDTNTLLILDNFDGVMDEAFTELLRMGWKLIVVTRSDMSVSGYPCQEIDELRGKDELRQLFESHMGRKLKAEEFRKFDRLVEVSAGHTLVVSLIARQIAKSYLEVDKALRLAEANGFSEMAPEKVDYVQDGTVFYDKISAILKAVYDVSALSSDKKKCLKILSLFDVPGIDIREVKQMLELETLDDINELKELGWLEMADRSVQLHPLIQETVHQMEWTDECRNIAVKGMKTLSKEISENGKKYSGRQYEVLHMSKSVLLHGRKDAQLYSEDGYKELKLATLMNLPKDEEDYIISNAQTLLCGNGCKDPCDTMELYDYVGYLLCRKEDFEEAGEYLKRAHLFAKKQKDHYIWGVYYDMLSDYYEALLDGAYDARDESQLVDRVSAAAERAVYHMGRARHKKAKKLSVKYMISQVGFMIRSEPEKSGKIKKLLSEVERILRGRSGKGRPYMAEADEAYSTYFMVWAWYYTLCEPDEELAGRYLREAATVNERRDMSEMDAVDDFYIPAANMMCELGDAESALNLLEEAIAVCNAHADSIPFIRKKLDLLEYELEVCDCEGDEEMRRRVLLRMDSVRQEMAEWSI